MCFDKLFMLTHRSVTQYSVNHIHLHFMIGKDHRIDLYRIDKIGIIADQSGELRLSNLVQLL